MGTIPQDLPEDPWHSRNFIPNNTVHYDMNKPAIPPEVAKEELTNVILMKIKCRSLKWLIKMERW